MGNNAKDILNLDQLNDIENKEKELFKEVFELAKNGIEGLKNF